MSLLQVTNLTFEYEGSFTPVFDGVSFQIDTDWKLGFVGRNGKGKTTFLKILMGELEYSGQITGRIPCDYFPFPVKEPWRDTWEVLWEVTEGEAETWQIERELSKLRVAEDVLYRPFSTLSNGEQTKVLLVALFLREGHFLLIDEPTNHLDQEARRLVSDYLNGKKGFILVSHDRAFLDGCVDHILAVNRTDIQVQRGNFSSWFENKERQDAFEQAENERLKKDVKRLEAAARQSERWADRVEGTKIGGIADRLHANVGSRAYIGEKSRRLQQRRKNLERRQNRAIEEKRELLKNTEQPEHLKLFPLKHHADRILVLDRVQPWYEGAGQPVCQPVSLELRQGQRIFLKGSNGCGKTSLLRLVLEALSEQQAALGQQMQQEALGQQMQQAAFRRQMQGAAAGEQITGAHPILPEMKGEIRAASGLKVSWVSQDTSGLKGSLRDYAGKNGVEEHLFLALLRKLDFSRDQFEKPMEHYSQGQKKKVLIARSLCEQAHLYIWDEPLNYIDIYSRMQIEELILQFQPTVLLVEHDAAFAQKTASQEIPVVRL